VDIFTETSGACVFFKGTGVWWVLTFTLLCFVAFDVALKLRSIASKVI
jgi:hypothetical protein